MAAMNQLIRIRDAALHIKPEWLVHQGWNKMIQICGVSPWFYAYMPLTHLLLSQGNFKQ